MKLTTQALNKAIRQDEAKLRTLAFGSKEYLKLSLVIETAKYMMKEGLL